MIEIKLINFLYFLDTPDFLKGDFPSVSKKFTYAFKRLYRIPVPNALQFLKGAFCFCCKKKTEETML